MTEQPHISVLLDESLLALNLAQGDIAIDCTTGAGGHTEKMLEAVGHKGRVIGLDRDDAALALAGRRLAAAVREGRLTLVKAPFSDVARVAQECGVTGQVAGVLADIGVSSMHLDQADRGFSFMREGPLDMRMDQTQATTAASLLAEASEQELAKLFFELGEEPQSRQIAHRIVQVRGETPIETTSQLADLVKGAVRYKTKSEKHPATKVFQALRLAVNDELGQLRRLVDDGFAVLRPKGRLAVISFHSLEDRIVKQGFQDLSGKSARRDLPRNLPYTEAQVQAMLNVRGEIVKPFPTTPSDTEINRNPRSRSAKLRTIAKI